MDAVIAENGEGVAGHRLKPDHGDRFVGNTIGIVAQHPAALAVPGAAVHVHLRLTGAEADSGRLQICLRLASHRHQGVLHFLDIFGSFSRHVSFRRFAVGSDGGGSVGVNRGQQDVIPGNPGLLAEPGRHLLPKRGGHGQQLDADQGGLAGAVVHDDCADIETIANALETLEAARVPAHRQGGIGGGRDVDFGGTGP